MVLEENKINFQHSSVFFFCSWKSSALHKHTANNNKPSVKHRLLGLHSELHKCWGLTRLRSRSLFRTLPFVFSQKPTPLVWRVHPFNYPWFCEAKTTWSQLLKGLFFNTPLSFPQVHKLLLFQFESGQIQWRGINSISDNPQTPRTHANMWGSSSRPRSRLWSTCGKVFPTVIPPTP